MKRVSGCPAIFDASHAVQLPGGGGSTSGGEPRHIEALARAAVAAGADGLFIEVHPDPESAMSDGYQSLTLDQFQATMEKCRRVAAAVDRVM